MAFEHESTSGISRNSRDAVVNLQGELGNPTHTARISVNATPAATTLSSGKRTMILYNTGTKDCFFGASGVSNTTGGVMYSGTAFQFNNCKDSFAVWLVTAATETTTINRVEF